MKIIFAIIVLSVACAKAKDDSSESDTLTTLTGKITFEDDEMASSDVHVSVPGEPLAATSNDKGEFILKGELPSGKHTVRMQKGVYTKDVKVKISAGDTKSLGTTEIGLLERNPLPLVNVLEGTWTETCYYTKSSIGSSAESPSTGVLFLRAAYNNIIENGHPINNAYYIQSGYSCLVDNITTSPQVTQALIVISDEYIIRKFGGPSAQYSLYTVTSYTNDKINLEIAFAEGSSEKKTLVELTRIP